MIRVRAPSRLHLGLLSFAGESPCTPPEEIVPPRKFGSVGLMVQDPGVALVARTAPAWSAEGPLAERVLSFVQVMLQGVNPETVVPLHFQIDACAPEHAGLGTGTQLGMAVASALHMAGSMANLTVTDLARRIGRGRRSALGVHGFEQGGFLVDGGKSDNMSIAPLVARIDFPEDWPVLLVLPPGRQGIHGDQEIEAFGRLVNHPLPNAYTDKLCRLVLLGMLPSLAERNLNDFGEALYEFNSLVGEAFAPVQGGRYAHPYIGELVRFIRRQGIAATGQSSWGPAVFAVAESLERANRLKLDLRRRFALEESALVITRADNRGAQLQFV
jgi:beta-ribofuranosylaminobenzene 5'-phosphate synthase